MNPFKIVVLRISVDSNLISSASSAEVLCVLGVSGF